VSTTLSDPTAGAQSQTGDSHNAGKQWPLLIYTVRVAAKPNAGRIAIEKTHMIRDVFEHEVGVVKKYWGQRAVVTVTPRNRIGYPRGSVEMNIPDSERRRLSKTWGEEAFSRAYPEGVDDEFAERLKACVEKAKAFQAKIATSAEVPETTAASNVFDDA
jgi:hypothetical protein